MKKSEQSNPSRQWLGIPQKMLREYITYHTKDRGMTWLPKHLHLTDSNGVHTVTDLSDSTGGGEEAKVKEEDDMTAATESALLRRGGEQMKEVEVVSEEAAPPHRMKTTWCNHVQVQYWRQCQQHVIATSRSRSSSSIGVCLVCSEKVCSDPLLQLCAKCAATRARLIALGYIAEC